jgi:sulfite reductase (NADPH) flavoprotein alpha-component
MLAELNLDTFKELVQKASEQERAWMHGYLSALLHTNTTAVDKAVVAAKPAVANCTVVYGTETGNSKKVAVDFSNKLKKNGVQVKIKSLDQYKVNDLEKESCLLVVMSTQGDGEPPAAAKKFYDYIHENKVALNKLKYGVLALGDTSYPLFCKAGEDVDVKLHELGAERLLPLQKCDVDFETDANEWIDALLNAALSSSANTAQTVAKAKPKAGKKIYNGVVAAAINLNDVDSNKETFHIEITSDEEIVYESGDSLGVIAYNKPEQVAKVIDLLDADASQAFTYKEQTATLQDLFTTKINIQHLPERLVKEYAKLVNKEIPAIKIDLADLLRIYPCDKCDKVIDTQRLLDILEPIAPRLYSISSSPAAHGENEIHITVSRNKFNIDGHERFGLCSDYLCGLDEGTQLHFYIQKNNAFRLPDANADVIMIGPGTGIAPFRSFLYERDAQGAEGRNWLFFGEQHFTSDFLYQTELQSLLETNVLTKLNTAFSRDQKEKVYVQHRMLQQAEELYNWIENGAHLYVCGAKEPMSVDVDETLVSIVAYHGNKTVEDARTFIDDLHEAGRYHKDVY